MLKKTVFLLQDTKEAIDELVAKFSAEQDFEVVGVTTDGISAISMIEEKRPLILITELVLSGYDGIAVIEKVKELNLNTKIVVLSALNSDEAISRTVNAGANYFMAKPIEFDVLKQRIIGILENKVDDKAQRAYPSTFRNITLEEKISKIFINIGIPPHIKGYSFLREGVKKAVEDPEIINNITKKLYPSIGEKYNTSASKVERAIRHAIEVAWDRGDTDVLNGIFGYTIASGKGKPTNSEFIAMIADRLRLQLKAS
jgi:two-component system response regulator (stage 0 sporulation protein A)